MTRWEAWKDRNDDWFAPLIVLPILLLIILPACLLVAMCLTLFWLPLYIAAFIEGCIEQLRR